MRPHATDAGRGPPALPPTPVHATGVRRTDAAAAAAGGGHSVAGTMRRLTVSAVRRRVRARAADARKAGHGTRRRTCSHSAGARGTRSRSHVPRIDRPGHGCRWNPRRTEQCRWSRRKCHGPQRRWQQAPAAAKGDHDASHPLPAIVLPPSERRRRRRRVGEHTDDFVQGARVARASRESHRLR